jgi:hypothetical protein
MKTDKVTREDLRAIHVGETRSFTLPTFAACLSARAQAATLKPLDGRVFTTTIDQDTLTIHITRYEDDNRTSRH